MTVKASLEKVIPILRTGNADAAIAYYEMLGFKEDWRHQFEPDFPIFTAISRGNVRLFLSEHTGDGQAGVHVFVKVDDVDAFYTECRRGGAKITAPPEDQPFGVRQMAIKDPDGNVLIFGMPIPEEA